MGVELAEGSEAVEQLGGFYAERSGKLFGRGDVLKRRVEQHEVFLEC